MICRSRKLIEPFDVFYAKVATEFGERWHYYVCVYSQHFDEKIPLSNDIYGLLITSNKKYNNKTEYSVKFSTEKFDESYIICDKLTRIIIDADVFNTDVVLSEKTKSEVIEKLDSFISEIKKQIGGIKWFIL